MAQSEALSKERNDANRLYDKVSKLVDLLSSQAKKAETARKAPGADQAKAEAEQQEASERERRGIELRQSTELWIKWLASAAPHFENLPVRVGKSVKTDSVGRFALAIPKDKNVVVVAVVESSVTGELETHFWIAKVATHENQVTLSSKNETAAKLTGSTGAGDSLLSWTKPLKASLAGLNIPELRASIERELGELSKPSASFR